MFGDVLKLRKGSNADSEGWPNYLVYIKEKLFVVGHDHFRKAHYKFDGKKMFAIKYYRGHNPNIKYNEESLNDYYPIPTCKAPKQIRNFVRSEILLYVNV